jgi:hypothetical protein
MTTESPIIARWRDWDGHGLEHLVVREDEEGIRADSFVIGNADGTPFAARYSIVCIGNWRTRAVTVSLLGHSERIQISGDGSGGWRDAEGKPIADLAGAIDVDITCTPFTNTLPIRRLALGAGESADITVAYIDVPSLTLMADPQRYTCLEPMRRYRFESLDSDFTREIEVDEHGLVVNYPGLFRRVL